MSKPSQWPLPMHGARILTPDFMLRELRANPIARGCYPTAIGFYPVAAGHTMTRASHDNHLLIFCANGAGHLEAGDTCLRIAKNQLLLLPAGISHRYHADQSDPWSIYWCHFEGTLAGEFVSLLGDLNSVMLQPIQQVAGLTRDFEDLLQVRLTGYLSINFIHAANLLRKIITAAALEKKLADAATHRSMNFAEVERYMRANIDQTLKLEDLATLANLSKFHFSTKYRELTGYSPIKHFLHMKIERACELLDTTDMSITAVSAAVGYDDPLYFSRLFTKTTGIPPRLYREKIRGEI